VSFAPWDYGADYYYDPYYSGYPYMTAYPYPYGYGYPYYGSGYYAPRAVVGGGYGRFYGGRVGVAVDGRWHRFGGRR